MGLEELIILEIKRGANRVMNKLREDIKKELIDQGHKNTGNFEKNIDIVVTTTKNTVIASMYMPDYWKTLEEGLTTDQVRSLTGHVEALTKYFVSKSNPITQARNIAILTRNRHLREGLPTRASYRFSKNGRRTGFLSISVAKNMDSFREIMESQSSKGVEAALLSISRKYGAASSNAFGGFSATGTFG